MRRRIAFLTSLDATTRWSWSGIMFYMARALQEHCGDVIHLGPVTSGAVPTGRRIDRLSRRFLSRKYNYHHSFALARSFAREFERRLPKDVDVIFAPAASTEIALLRTEIPIVYTSDATFRIMHDYYPSFGDLLQLSAWESDGIERRALERAAAVLYPSRWAAQSAIRDYGVDPARIHVFPYGANLDRVPDADALHESKRDDACTLLFLGRDWQRKGGRIAYQTASILRRMGVEARLVVCGCKPAEPYDPELVRVIPRVNKDDPAEQTALSQLLTEANFLLLPTRMECFGIVFCEASAYGTPCIATDTGGVSGAVTHGTNGFLLSPTAGPEAYASLIRDLFRDKERYRALVASTRRSYEERLNWDVWAERVNDVLTGLLETGRSRGVPPGDPNQVHERPPGHSA